MRDIRLDYRGLDGKEDRDCALMQGCLCCDGEDQLAGPIGGGDFRTKPMFGCILFEPREPA